MFHKNVFALVLLFAGLTVASEAIGQKAGDRVVVSATVGTKIRDQRVGRVYMGAIDTVTQVNGKWCALSRSKGWLPLQYVMNLDMGDKHFSSRIAKNKSDYDAWAIRAMIRFEKNQQAAALSDINQSIMLFQRNPVAFNNRGIILKAQGKYTEALANFNKSIELNKSQEHPDAYENRGLVLMAIGQNAEALKSFDKAISLNKENPWTYINRGSAKNNLGKYQQAKSDFAKALKIDKDISDAYVGLSIVYLAQRDFEKAFKFAEQAIKKNGKNGLAFNQRGWTNYKLGDLDKALYDFDQAIRYAPGLSLAYNNRGVCYSDLGKFPEALKDLNRAIKINSKSAVALTNRGTVHMAVKDYSKAKSDLEQAVKLAPKFADAANGLGWFLATCPEDNFRDGNKALKVAESACKLSDWKEWSYIDTLAAAHAEVGQFEDAIKMEEKAMSMATGDEKKECAERLASFRANKAYRSDFGKIARKSRS